MINNRSDSNWIASIDGKSTFAGIIVDHYNEMCDDNYWRAESTKNNYRADYERRILPFIEDHDQRTIDSYTLDQYREIIFSIRNTGRFTEDRIMHFMRLIAAVAQMANKKYNYPNVLSGTAFDLPLTSDEKEGIRELLTLKRSLGSDQELTIYHKLTKDYRMSGELFGALLMFVFGVRNGEAAAITFSDIMESYVEDGFHILMIYKTIESKNHRRVSSGKTPNADRIIPVPDDIYSFLMQRRKYISEQTGKTPKDVNELPIACIGNDFEKACYPDQIAQAAKMLFFEIGLKPKVLSYLDYEIMNGEDPVVVKEKEPTSYLMRRNFATQMAIIGMNEAEIQFLLGHDITDSYETRNEMISFDALKQMSYKMQERGIFYHKIETIDIPRIDNNTEYCITDFSAININITISENETLLLRVNSDEPQGKIIVKTRMDDNHTIDKTDYTKKPDYQADRTINILNDYHRTYLGNK